MPITPGEVKAAQSVKGFRAMNQGKAWMRNRSAVGTIVPSVALCAVHCVGVIERFCVWHLGPTVSLKFRTTRRNAMAEAGAHYSTVQNFLLNALPSCCHHGSSSLASANVVRDILQDETALTKTQHRVFGAAETMVHGAKAAPIDSVPRSILSRLRPQLVQEATPPCHPQPCVSSIRFVSCWEE